MPTSQDQSLVTLAHGLGSHPLRLATGLEGSAAMRTEDGRLLVTPDGANLATLSASDLVSLDFEKMNGFLALDDLPDEALDEARLGGAALRPCADALAYAHLLADGDLRWAAHIQPIEVNQIICSPRARQFADRRSLPSEIIACGVSSVLVPYAPPGLALAKEMKRKIALWRDRFKVQPTLVLIQNHGMIVLGATPRAVIETTEMTVKSAQIFIGAALMGGPVFLSPHHVDHIAAVRRM